MNKVCPICKDVLTVTNEFITTCDKLDHKYRKMNFEFKTFTEFVIMGGYVIYFYPEKIVGHHINGKNHFTINQAILPNKEIVSLIENHFLLS